MPKLPDSFKNKGKGSSPIQEIKNSVSPEESLLTDPFVEAEIMAVKNAILSTDDPEELKAHVCPFYQVAHPSCKGCAKPEWKVLECKDHYLKHIEDRPMKSYSPLFDVPIVKVRDKKPLSEVPEMSLVCNNCYMAEKCSVYEKNATCGIDWESSGLDSGKKILDYLIGLQQKRVARASKFEEADGGVPDANLSNEMDRLAELATTKNNMDQSSFSIKIEGKAAGGDTPTPGILQTIFGNLKKPDVAKELPEAENRTIDIPFTEEGLGIKVDKNKNKSEDS